MKKVAKTIMPFLRSVFSSGPPLKESSPGEIKDPSSRGLKKTLSYKDVQLLSKKIRLKNEELKKSFSSLEQEVQEKVREVVYLKEYNERALMSVPDPMVIFDADLKIDYVNSAFKNVAEFKGADPLGKMLEEAELKFKVQWDPIIKGLTDYMKGVDLHEGNQEGNKYQARDPLDPGNVSKNFQSRSVMHLGERLFSYKFFDVVVNLKSDRRIGCLLRELTQERNLKDQLAEAERLAGLGRLAAGIGHELNNPLFGILGYSESILGQEASDKIHVNAKKIFERAQHMSGVIKKLSGDMGGGENYDEDVNLNEVVEAAINDSLKLVQGDLVQVEKKLGDLPLIKANFEEMKSIFSNIILNALQAMEGKGTLTVYSERGLENILVRIKDTGPGIPDEYLTKIFEPYFTTKAQGAGNGLGLNLVHRAIEKYGGKIMAEPDISSGASFAVTFPVNK